MEYKDLISANKVVLVEFFATWCPHCQRMMPVVERLREKLAGRVPVERFDIDKNQSLADSVGVESVPTFIIYREGEAVWNHSGEIDGAALLEKVESFAG